MNTLHVVVYSVLSLFHYLLCIVLRSTRPWDGMVQTAYKPGSVSDLLGRMMAIHLGRPLPNASRDQPGQRAKNEPCGAKAAACRPYSVLLPVGFTMPAPSRAPRCALTAPFHPYLPAEADRRFAFCGTFPGVTPAGRYPAPCFRGARTFLPRHPKTSKAAIRPSGP